MGSNLFQCDPALPNGAQLVTMGPNGAQLGGGKSDLKTQRGLGVSCQDPALRTRNRTPPSRRAWPGAVVFGVVTRYHRLDPIPLSQHVTT